MPVLCRLAVFTTAPLIALTLSSCSADPEPVAAPEITVTSTQKKLTAPPLPAAKTSTSPTTTPTPAASVTITAEHNRPAAGNDYNSINPKGSFSIVTVTLNNTGSTPMKIVPSTFSLQLNNGKKATYHSQATTLSHNTDTPLFAEVAPGAQSTIALYFDVPQGTTPKTFTLTVNNDTTTHQV